ncbi:type IV toxin-antitoxin system AbiEi family antitoxin domain-containing protein [Actinoplanes missouriensis]|uniref:type IV toxin-antitoxin system AbiEi family antitoxin domain-containing protein n=1 Tax=Actinoplanes missouriensis TaxID=1866 RepID=UPI0033EF2F60
MRDTDPELRDLLRRQQSVITWQQARRLLSEKAIRHRVDSGRWQRAHRGVYLAHSGPITEPQRWWIAGLSAGEGGPALLAGSTALLICGLRRPRDRDDTAAVHVLVPDSRVDRDMPLSVITHRTRHFPREYVRSPGYPPCTTAARSLIDAAQWALTDTAAITLVAAAVQQRVVGVDEAGVALRARRRVRRRRVIAAALADAGGGSESAYEVEFVRLCRRAGLPEPARQAVRVDRAGRRRYRDVFFEPWGVHVEIDGSQHMEVRGWYADMRSGNEVAISGVRLLRFPGWAVRHRPDEVVADVRAALTAAGWNEARHRAA